MGIVALVGAGPGDPELITVKGMKKLKECDVVLYDRLASEELLSFTRDDCIRICVGKRPGAHTMKQEEICRILVEYGRAYPKVVRLKGGDPFVFGRGGEEAEALRRAGIPFELVPGVTSAVAVPELAGIPVTHRGLARSFHVITGHTAQIRGDDGVCGEETDNLTGGYETFARLDGTLVFLMGLSSLAQITERLIFYGKPADTPAAVISEGTTAGQRAVRGVLSDIVSRVKQAGLTSPAVIVIGDVAALSFGQNADAGVRRCGAVATERTLSKLCSALKGTACEVVPLIKMRRVRTAEAGQLPGVLSRVREYDWVLFTSKEAVGVFFGTADACGMDARGFAGIRFGVIGKGTAATLREYGIRADFMPERADAEGFGEEFAEKYAKARVLIPRAAQGNPVLGELLARAGCQVHEIPVYDVKGEACAGFSELSGLSEFAFFSASGVRAFLEETAKAGKRIPAGSVCYCIGETAGQALTKELTAQENAAVRVIVAGEASVEGMAERIVAL